MRSIGRWLTLLVALVLSAQLYAERPFVVSTIPKTGTHLIQGFLEKLTGKEAVFASPLNLEPYAYVWDEESFLEQCELDDALLIHWFCSPVSKTFLSWRLDQFEEEGEFLSAHAPYSPEYQALLEEKGYVNFFIIRDPRDYTVSLTRHLRHFGSGMFPTWCEHLEWEEQLLYAIEGTDWYNGARYVYKAFLPWKAAPNTVCLRFEKLVGPSKGSCTPEEHLRELRKIADALEIDCDDATLLQAFAEAFGQGYTYTPAKVSGWQRIYEKVHREAAKDCFGDLLIELDYEPNLDW